MKGWLRLGMLFLIITSCIVVVNASANSNSACGTTVQKGAIVDVSRCASETDDIGWWDVGTNKKDPMTAFTSLGSDLHSVDTRLFNLGTYYVLSPKETATRKVFTII